MPGSHPPMPGTERDGGCRGGGDRHTQDTCTEHSPTTEQKHAVFSLKTPAEPCSGLLGAVCTGALRPLQSTGASPGSRVWRAASVRPCFHSLIPVTQLSSPRAACEEFNASLGCRKPHAGLHPRSPGHCGPPETHPAQLCPYSLLIKPKLF